MTKWNKILEFNDKYFPKWREVAILYYSNALAGEVGEICNSVKHFIGGGTNKREVDGEEVAIEGVDVLIYLTLLLERLGISQERFEEIFDFKMRTLVRRMENSE